MPGCLSRTPRGGSAPHTSPVPLQDPQGDALLPHHPHHLPQHRSSPHAEGSVPPQGKRGARTPGTLSLTSRISRILAPALPMSEPHWLAGMTRRSVTGALPTAAPSLPAPRSCEVGGGRCGVGPPRAHRHGASAPGSGGTRQGSGGAAHLLQFEGDHGDGTEDGVGGAGDGGDALGAGPL